MGEFHETGDKAVMHIAVARLVLVDWLGPVESNRPIKVWAAAPGRNRRFETKNMDAPWRYMVAPTGQNGEGSPAYRAASRSVVLRTLVGFQHFDNRNSRLTHRSPFKGADDVEPGRLTTEKRCFRDALSADGYCRVQAILIRN